MKKILKIILPLLAPLFFTFNSFGQIPPGYYDNAIGKTDTALQIALHNIIKGHNSISYTALWTAFQLTDKKLNGNVWDIYSDISAGIPPYEYTFVTDQCGNYSTEGDCYNREHSFPKSWFNSASPMYTDLFHLYPTDGYVNGKRSNWPYAEVDSATWTSLNGSKVGISSTPGYSSTAFEPIDNYKGDLARTYFYMAVRYYTEDSAWPGSDMVDGSQLKPWALNQLYLWHIQDTVSQKERDRNDSIYKIQGNRNPFIDRPDWVDSLWFSIHIAIKLNESIPELKLYPNPAQEFILIDLMDAIFSDEKMNLKILDFSGRIIEEQSIQRGVRHLKINTTNYKAGLYYVELTNGTTIKISKKLSVIN